MPSSASPEPDSGHLVSDDPLGPMVATRARIAVYDDMLSSPRVIDIEPAPLLRFIEAIASETYERAASLGGRLPYTAIREIAENFIHADFKECTVSILDRGQTISFSDQGPGIIKKQLVLRPGVTSASDAMRRYIKGVGSGFPIVKEYLDASGGYLSIDDNAVDGVVITLSLLPRPAQAGTAWPRPAVATPALPGEPAAVSPSAPLGPAAEQEAPAGQQATVKLNDPRLQAALLLIAEQGAAGPTDLVEPLGVSAATAHRLLTSLEDAGLVEKTVTRKRILSNAGLGYLQALEA